MIRFRWFLIVVVFSIASPSRHAAQAQAWDAWASPAAAGFDAGRLEAVRQHADSVQSGALMAVYRGHVLAAWGDVARPFRAHSVRKSLVSALYGILSADGTIDLDATLADLGIDDDTPLTPQERTARVRDLLAARSGVYLPAAYAPASQDQERPERGSHAPGTFWFYNNWDFNVAGVILERATGDGLYELFDSLIAQPLGMEDYEVDDGLRVYEPSRSRYPAHTFRMSARDLARFGQLYLQDGRWNDEQVIPAAWVDESTQPITHFDDTSFGEGTGYGYLWWTYDAGSLGKHYPNLRPYDLYMGRGTGGQAIFVVPGAGLVVAHRADTDHDREVPGRDVWRMVDRILGARTGEPAPDAPFTQVHAVPFASQLPAPDPPAFVDLAPEQWAAYHADYQIQPGTVIRVFGWMGRTFASFPGRGEAQLYALGDDRFTVRVVSGVQIQFVRDEQGAVTAMDVTMGADHIHAVRQ